MSDYIYNEIARVVPEGASVNVLQPVNPGYSVWLCGTILASVEGAIDMFVSKEKYDELEQGAES
ncbi:hypothetical protein N7488_007068 [Penicillium malachiteum]|nr:hypothetical protein N7488_007068 [Penicillium malachiteum]